MRIAVYARVSTEHEAQINALENQLEWYKIECSRHSDWEIVEVYVDQGITGTQAQKRPEFLRMMEDAQKGKFDLIITREVSRFARNTVDTLSYTRELKARGVDVFFINDGINTATNDGELRLTIMSSMAQDESRKISERVKAGQKISREKHILYGSGNILGYRRENGTYVPDPDQAETVRLIFQMYSTGENGLVKIVNELYRLGRLDAGGHVSWDASKVSRVLHNATYKGCICYNKSHSDGYLTQKRVKNLDESSYIYVKGDFEPLVSEEMWDRCQQILVSKSARVIDENGKKHKYIRSLQVLLAQANPTQFITCWTSLQRMAMQLSLWWNQLRANTRRCSVTERLLFTAPIQEKRRCCVSTRLLSRQKFISWSILTVWWKFLVPAGRCMRQCLLC